MRTAGHDATEVIDGKRSSTFRGYSRRIVERLVWAAATLLALATLVFALVRALPGDPAITLLGEFATPETIERTRETLGLDAPLYVQYLNYLQSIISGDLGESYRNGLPVTETIGSMVVPTLILALASTVIAIVSGIISGLVAARFRGGPVDAGLLMTAVALISVPSFWFGLVLIYIFSDVIQLFPATGSGQSGDIASQLRALVLPAIALSTGGAAMIARVARSSVLEVVGEDYLVVARAVGIKERTVTWHYALRNALPAILGTANVVFAISVANAVVIEAVFSRRGLGSLVLDATLTRDYPLIQGGLLAMAALVVLASVLSDLLFPLVEPRSRP